MLPPSSTRRVWTAGRRLQDEGPALSPCVCNAEPGTSVGRAALFWPEAARAANRLSPNYQDCLPLATLRAVALLLFLVRLQLAPRPFSRFGPARSRRRKGRAGAYARLSRPHPKPRCASYGSHAGKRMGTPRRTFTVDACDRIMVLVPRDPPDTRLWDDVRAPWQGSASEEKRRRMLDEHGEPNDNNSTSEKGGLQWLPQRKGLIRKPSLCLPRRRPR